MSPSVRDMFMKITSAWEGRIGDHVAGGSCMYLDVKGLVTTDIGVLIDPVQYALELPWRRLDGTLAEKQEVAVEWAMLKKDKTAAKAGWRRAAKITKLRLRREDVDALVLTKLDNNMSVLRMKYPGIDAWPQDAILATLSMSWALGPRFGARWPKLDAALYREQFDVAALECFMREDDNPGVAPRNAANRLMFENAHIVELEGSDRAVLHYPARVIRSQEANG